MRRIAFAAILMSVFATQAARANDADPADKAAKDPIVSESTSASATVPAADPAPEAQMAPALRLTVAPRKSRPMALPALYGGLIALQGYDVYSTEKALGAGAVEANPHLKALVNNRPLFIGVKAVMTAGPIFAAERMWHDHHRVGAIALMAAANGIMAAVAAHNTQVIAHQR
jgi:hypothetical protein